MTQPAQVEDLYRHRAVTTLAASGEAWAFSVKSPDKEQGGYRGGLWMLDRDGELKQLTREGRSASSPQWSSDDRQLAFVRSADRVPQVFVLPMSGGEARQASRFEDGVVSIEQWDAQRDRMLVRALKKLRRDTQEPWQIDHLPYKRDGSGPIAGERVELYELDAANGAARALVDAGGDVDEARWSPDGGTLAWIQRQDGTQRHAMDLWLRRGDAAPRQLTRDLVSISEIAWSPDGKRIAVTASEVEGSSISGLYLIDAADGAHRRIGKLETALPAALAWGADGRRLYLTEAHRGMQRIVSVAADGDADLQVVFEDPQRQVAEMAMAGERIAFVLEGPDDGPELWLADASGANARQVSRFNDWRKQRASLGAERRRFRVPDGEGGEEEIEGWLLKPRGEGPFPLLLDMHGGPHSFVRFEFPTQVHWPVLVEQGWAILALNSVGSGSYGEAFARRICGRWGELDFPQYAAAVEQLRAEGVAGRHVATFGHSYGGFLSAWTLTRDMPLLCGVVSAGVINLESHTGTSDTGYYVGPYSVGCELESDRKAYHRLSPISYADDVRAPVLLLQGDEDERCPSGQAEEFFARLVRSGRTEARMLLFPGGTHHLSSTGKPGHRVRYFEALADWLACHLREADMKNSEPTPIRERNPLEKSRAPDAPAPRRGDQPGKRDNAESNDPESEAGARRGRREAAN